MVKDWTEEVESFLKLEVGRNEFDITGEATVEVNRYGKKQLVFPTNLGLWRVSNRSPIAGELAKYRKTYGTMAGAHTVVDRKGEGTDTRYNLVSIKPASKQTPISASLTLEQAKEHTKNLPEAQRELFVKYLKDTGQLKE